MNDIMKVKKLPEVKSSGLIINIRCWLIKKLAGNMSIVLNTEIKTKSCQRGFYLEGEYMYLEGNHFEGDGNTSLEIGKVGNYKQ